MPWGARTAIVGASAGQVTGLVANEAAFAGILSSTNGVIALGSKHNGGDVTSDARCNGFMDELSSGVKSITAAACAFTALKTDNTVYSWGNEHCGAGVSSVSNTALVGVMGAACMIEMTYHLQLNAALGPELTFLGATLNAAGFTSWFGAIFVMVTGFGLFELCRRQFLRQQAVGAGEGLVGTIVKTVLDAVVGIVAGGIVVAVVTGVKKLWPKKSATAN